MIVLNVQRKSATAMVLTALEEVQVGDGVEVMDVSDAPILAPIQPSFTNAPQPEAASANTMPPKINCSASPTSLRAGESASISCEAVSPDNRPVNITYVANGGKLSSNRNQATLDTTDAGPGPIAVRATAFDDRQLSASTVVSVNVEAAAPASPTAQKLMELDYKPNSGYVDNRSKAVLDDVALKMQQDPNLNAVLTGSADSGEPRSLGLQRAQNAMAYLTKAKGIDPQRIQAKAGNRARTQSRSLDFARRSDIAGSDTCSAATRNISAGAAANHPTANNAATSRRAASGIAAAGSNSDAY